MPKMIDTIKRCALEAVENSDPVRLLFGSVVSVNPISVKIDQKYTLPKEFILLTKTVFESGLESGDRVILIQVQGGQTYIIIDKVVQP